MAVAIIAGWLLVRTVLASASYALAAAHFAGRFFARPMAGVSSFPSVTILKPLHGAEPGLSKNLESFCTQDYPGVVQLLFGVQRAEDAAIPVVEALRKAYSSTSSARLTIFSPAAAPPPGSFPCAMCYPLLCSLARSFPPGRIAPDTPIPY